MSTPLPRLTLVLGGARSGKRRHAEALAQAAAPSWVYIATGEGLDDAMRARIAEHQARKGEGRITLEASFNRASLAAIRAVRSGFRPPFAAPGRPRAP